MSTEAEALQKKRKIDDDPEHSSVAPVAGLLIKRHSEKAKLPTRGSPLAAGYDLYRCAPHASSQSKCRLTYST
jgi:dUTP pyrophosphatase